MEIFWSLSDFQAATMARGKRTFGIFTSMSLSFADITDTPLDVLNDIYCSTTTTRAASESQSRDISTALDITGRNRPLDADHVTDLKNVFEKMDWSAWHQKTGSSAYAPLPIYSLAMRHGLMSSRRIYATGHKPYPRRLRCLLASIASQHCEITLLKLKATLQNYGGRASSMIEVSVPLRLPHRPYGDEDEHYNNLQDDCVDTLPMHLDQSMRYNRTDSAMPDSHAQVWMQLVAIISRQQDEKVSDGDAVNSDQDPLVNVGDPVLDALRLATARSSSRLGSLSRCGTIGPGDASSPNGAGRALELTRLPSR
ncbi:hypothetical protein E4U15_006835 [Claviceps sp. LM218 group G6]|nr:hypothetical protein E4U15_006835 [Claviceps sp. LM218 group G6]